MFFYLPAERMRIIRQQIGWSKAQLADYLFHVPEREALVDEMEAGARPIQNAVALLVAALAPDAADYLRAGRIN